MHGWVLSRALCARAAHEVVEVDGFVFRRKRAPAAAPASASKRSARGGGAGASDASVHPAPAQPAAGGAAPACDPGAAAAAAPPARPPFDADAAAADAAAALTALPAGGAAEPERLLALCELLAQARAPRHERQAAAMLSRVRAFQFMAPGQHRNVEHGRAVWLRGTVCIHEHAAVWALRAGHACDM